MAEANKVLIIGIDGGTFDIVKPLVNSGRMPIVKRMIEEGCCGVLRSVIPPVTATAWCSFMTGKNPGKHGVFNFMNLKDYSYATKLANSTSIKSKTIWQLLSEQGKRVITVNVPFTYPPYAINGIMVSGLLSPRDSIYTYPKELTEELNRRGYIIDIYWDKIYSQRDFIDFVYKMTERRFEIASDFIVNKPWDAFAVVFTGSDKLQHKVWENKKELEKYYIRLDDYIGRLLEKVGAGTYTIIMSDHGFTSTPRTFYVNEWLAKMGLLSRKKGSSASSLTSWGEVKRLRTKKTDALLYRMFRKIGFSREIKGKLIPESVWHFFRRLLPRSFGQHIPSPGIVIDWSKTKAFSNPPSTININLKGERREGIVERGGEYEGLRNFIIEEASKVVDPVSAEKVIEKVYKGEELYQGEHINGAPDLLLMSKDMKYCLANSETNRSIISRSDRFKSFHTMDGIFMATGQQIGPKRYIQDINIMDLAPTVLHILDTPIPEDMDGKIKRDIFKDDSELKRKEEKTQPSTQVYDTAAEEEEEEEELQRRLKELGYLS